jgi:tripartite-type tricarboxylate transporter receptor subunit TctC
MNNLQLIAGPRGIPRERINILAEAFQKTYKNRSWQSLAKKLMLKTNWRGPDEAQQAIRDEFNKVGKLVERIKKQKK